MKHNTHFQEGNDPMNPTNMTDSCKNEPLLRGKKKNQEEMSPGIQLA